MNLVCFSKSSKYSCINHMFQVTSACQHKYIVSIVLLELLNNNFDLSLDIFEGLKSIFKASEMLEESRLQYRPNGFLAIEITTICWCHQNFKTTIVDLWTCMCAVSVDDEHRQFSKIQLIESLFHFQQKFLPSDFRSTLRSIKNRSLKDVSNSSVHGNTTCWSIIPITRKRVSTIHPSTDNTVLMPRAEGCLIHEDYRSVLFEKRRQLQSKLLLFD